MATFAKPYQVKYNPLAVEFITIKKAIIFYVQVGFSNGDIISYSKEAEHLINTPYANLDSNCFLVEDIKVILYVHFNFNVTYVSRKC